MSKPSVIALEAEDPYLRWAVSRLLAWQRSDLEFMDCGLTRMFCKRLVLDARELVGKSFVWELPLRNSRSLRYYEEDFIEQVLPIAYRLPALIVVASDDVPLRRVAKLCDLLVSAEYTRGGFAYSVKGMSEAEYWVAKRYVATIGKARERRTVSYV